MVGGTRIHRQMQERALVEMEEREEFLFGEENTSPAARTLFVSLDRADAIIEGAPGVVFTPGSRRAKPQSPLAQTPGHPSTPLDRPPRLRVGFTLARGALE